MSETKRTSLRKVRVGKVISAKMDKSFTMEIERVMRHPMYVKTYRSSSKLMVHDENNEASVGDVCKVMETRPMSKHKRWRLVEILEKAK